MVTPSGSSRRFRGEAPSSCFLRCERKPVATTDSLEATELYSEELGIDLAVTDDGERFRWFLASVLYGARISETIARNSYRAFEAHDLHTPEAILDAGFDYLVDPIMREGGYVRYDNRRSRQILRDCETR